MGYWAARAVLLYFRQLECQSEKHGHEEVTWAGEAILGCRA